MVDYPLVIIHMLCVLKNVHLDNNEFDGIGNRSSSRKQGRAAL
jgi:hypothetical protein